MLYRNNVSIKTKFSTIQECIDKCRDYKGETMLAGSFTEGISGIVNENGSFVLSSRKRYGNLFEFVGRVEQKDDGIYMVGDIKPRCFAKYLSYFGIGLGLIIGVALIVTSSIDNDSRLFGLVMIIFPWVNILVLQKSNSLYKHIVNKVERF